MKKLKAYFLYAWIALVVLLTPVFLSAPIWWKLGPPPPHDFETVQGKIIIPNYRSRSEFKPYKYLLIRPNGTIKEIHCGFIVAKRECGFDRLFRTNQEVQIRGKYHWYWGLLEYQATIANGLQNSSSTFDDQIKYFFKDDRKYHGLGFWFLSAGVIAFLSILAVFVLLPLWLTDRLSKSKS